MELLTHRESRGRRKSLVVVKVDSMLDARPLIDKWAYRKGQGPMRARRMGDDRLVLAFGRVRDSRTFVEWVEQGTPYPL